MLLVILVVAQLYFQKVSGSSRYLEKSLESIPGDASVIFQFTNDKGFYEIFADYRVFDDIIGREKKKELIFLKNQLLNNQKLALITNGQNLYLSLHHDHDSISFLWIMPLKENLSRDDYTDLFGDTDSTTHKVKDSNDTLSIEIFSKANNKTFYLNISHGTAKGSYSKSLLEACLDPKQPKISKDFINEIAIANGRNENSPANAFIKFQTAGVFLKSFYKSQSSLGLLKTYDLKGFASLSMNFRSDALVFNGLVSPDTTTLVYQNIFLHQAPIHNTIEKILPENTANFIGYGLSNYKNFENDIRHFLINKNQWQEFQTSLASIKKKTGIDLNLETAPLWDREFMAFQLSTQEQLGAIKLTNGEKLNFVLEPISVPYSDKVRKFTYPNIPYAYFGEPFKQFSKPYYSIIDNYLVFANSAGTVQRFLSSYNNDQVLYKTANYIQFSKSVADMSNIFLFVHNYNSRTHLKNGLKSPFSELLRHNNLGINKFYGFSCQFTSNSTYYLTNILSEYSQNSVPNANDRQEKDTVSTIGNSD